MIDRGGVMVETSERAVGHSTARSLRVVLADDHARMRARIREALEAGSCAVSAEAATAQEAIECAEAHVPDIVLLDIHMPGNGIWAARELSGRLPGTPVVMLTHHIRLEHESIPSAATDSPGP